MKRDSIGRVIGKRRDNGPEDHGLTEDQQIVRGPSKLLEAMRARAAREGITVAEAWRQAGAAWLRTR